MDGEGGLKKNGLGNGADLESWFMIGGHCLNIYFALTEDE